LLRTKFDIRAEGSGSQIKVGPGAATRWANVALCWGAGERLAVAQYLSAEQASGVSGAGKDISYERQVSQHALV
jgi:hypothetical protein